MKHLLISGRVAAVFAALVCLCGCNDSIDVRQDYDFSVSMWHLPSEINVEEEVQIRFTLRSAGNFAGAFYCLTYIQIEGTGEVYDTEGTRLQSQKFRGLTSLPELDARDPRMQVFTLYYKSLSDVPSEVQFIVQDNFGQERALNVSFSPKAATDQSGEHNGIMYSFRVPRFVP